jgi:hypothetical protein
VAKTLELYKNGRSLYLMDALPGDLKKYKISYIFITNQIDPPTLFYINYSGQSEPLTLTISPENQEWLNGIIYPNTANNRLDPLQKILSRDDLTWFWEQVRAHEGHFDQVIDGIYHRPEEKVAEKTLARHSTINNFFSFFKKEASPFSDLELVQRSTSTQLVGNVPISPAPQQPMLRQDSEVLNLSLYVPPVPARENVAPKDSGAGVTLSM